MYQEALGLKQWSEKKNSHLINENVKPNQSVHIEPQATNLEKFQNIVTKKP